MSRDAHGLIQVGAIFRAQSPLEVSESAVDESGCCAEHEGVALRRSRGNAFVAGAGVHLGRADTQVGTQRGKKEKTLNMHIRRYRKVFGYCRLFLFSSI